MKIVLLQSYSENCTERKRDKRSIQVFILPNLCVGGKLFIGLTLLKLTKEKKKEEIILTSKVHESHYPCASSREPRHTYASSCEPCHTYEA